MTPDPPIQPPLSPEAAAVAAAADGAAAAALVASVSNNSVQHPAIPHPTTPIATPSNNNNELHRDESRIQMSCASTKLLSPRRLLRRLQRGSLGC